MAEAMTYSSLFTDIQRYLERGQVSDPDVYAQIPRFIMLAEQRLAVELKTLGSIKFVTTTFTPSTATLVKPERWRDTVSVSVTVAGEKQYLFPRSYEFLRSFWPDSTVTGTPRYYSDYDYDHWLFAPTPATNLSLEIAYHERVDPLDSTNQTNWWTAYVPQALLYASLLEAMIFLKDDDRIAAYQQFYDRVMASIGGEDKERSTDRSSGVRKQS